MSIKCKYFLDKKMPLILFLIVNFNTQQSPLKLVESYFFKHPSEKSVSSSSSLFLVWQYLKAPSLI